MLLGDERRPACGTAPEAIRGNRCGSFSNRLLSGVVNRPWWANFCRADPATSARHGSIGATTRAVGSPVAHRAALGLPQGPRGIRRAGRAFWLSSIRRRRPTPSRGEKNGCGACIGTSANHPRRALADGAQVGLLIAERAGLIRHVAAIGEIATARGSASCAPTGMANRELTSAESDGGIGSARDPQAAMAATATMVAAQPPRGRPTGGGGGRWRTSGVGPDGSGALPASNAHRRYRAAAVRDLFASAASQDTMHSPRASPRGSAAQSGSALENRGR